MPTANKMVSENKGKEGKSHRLDITYKRNSTHECGTITTPIMVGGIIQKSRKKYEGNLSNELKVKEERKEKELDI